MKNNPFISKNVNVNNETCYNIAPASIANQNTMIAHERQRSLVDTLTTSINGVSDTPVLNIPQARMQQPMSYNCSETSLATQGILVANAQPIHGGVIFTFNTKPVPLPNSSMYMYGNNAPVYMDNMYGFCNNCHGQHVQERPLTLEEQIALIELEKTNLEAMLLQEKLKKHPFKLQFHHDAQTSTHNLKDSKPTKTQTICSALKKSKIDKPCSSDATSSIGSTSSSNMNVLHLPPDHSDLQPQTDEKLLNAVNDASLETTASIASTRENVAQTDFNHETDTTKDITETSNDKVSRSSLKSGEHDRKELQVTFCEPERSCKKRKKNKKKTEEDEDTSTWTSDGKPDKI